MQRQPEAKKEIPKSPILLGLKGYPCQSRHHRHLSGHVNQPAPPLTPFPQRTYNQSSRISERCIAVRRLEQYDGQQVRYWYKDHKTQAIQHVTLPVLHFIGRMVQHILPKGFQRIRYFGLHCHTHYQQIREQLDALLPGGGARDPRGYRVLPRPSFRQLFLATFGQEPLLCPRCGTEMEWELLYHPKYGILKEAQLFQDEPPNGRTESDSSAVAAEEAGGDPLARPIPLVQLPLPFL
jgi:hypothetical protein